MSESSENFEIIPLSKLRQVVGKKTGESFRDIPHFYTEMEVDMGRIAEVRESIEKEKGIRLSYQAFLLKAIATALTEFPCLNSSCQGEEVKRYNQVNIGLVVAIPDGVLIPVLKDANQRSVFEIGKEARRLVDIAQKGKVPFQEMTGGTFTITNLGPLGVDRFHAVIFPPQAGILAIGAIKERPVVREGQVVARPTMNLVLSADHRVVDGMEAANFLTRIKNILENWEEQP